MNPNVFYEERRRQIVAACEACWEAHKKDCSGFVRAVAAHLKLNATAVPNGKTANELCDHFANDHSNWFYIGQGNDAVPMAGTIAHEGGLVVAAWKNPDWAGGKDDSYRGHLAIVCEYMATRNSPRPVQALLAYWGTWSSDGNATGDKAEKMSLSFGKDKHKEIKYYSAKNR